MISYQSDRAAQILALEHCPRVAVDFGIREDSGPLYDSPKGALGNGVAIETTIDEIYIKCPSGEIRDITNWYKVDPDFKKEVDREVQAVVDRML